MPESEDKPESQARAVAFERRLQELGWISGRNLQIDYRWGMGEVEKARGNRRLAEIDTKRADRRCKPRNRSDAADDPHDPDRLRERFGTISLSRSSHFAPKVGSRWVKPVRLPPGWARLATKPWATGSLTASAPHSCST